MTCREKLAIEHPREVCFETPGGCFGCPHDHNYLPKPDFCCLDDSVCTKCWDREIPESNGTDSADETERDFYQVRVEFVDRDRVSMYHSETCTVSTEVQAVILKNVKYYNWEKIDAEGIVIPLKNIRTLSYKKVNENDVSTQN